MARVTVEDCVLRVPNRFNLVMLAAQRARDLAGGAQLTVDKDNDKNPVIALREIADSTVDLAILENLLIKGLQKIPDSDEPEEEVIEFMADEQAFAPGIGLSVDEDLREEALSVVGEDDDEPIAIDADEVPVDLE